MFNNIFSLRYFVKFVLNFPPSYPIVIHCVTTKFLFSNLKNFLKLICLSLLENAFDNPHVVQEMLSMKNNLEVD